MVSRSNWEYLSFTSEKRVSGQPIDVDSSVAISAFIRTDPCKIRSGSDSWPTIFEQQLYPPKRHVAAHHPRSDRSQQLVETPHATTDFSLFIWRTRIPADHLRAGTCRESGKRHHPCVPVHPLWPQTPEQCPIPTIRGSHAPSCNFALIREVRSRTTLPRLHTLSCLTAVNFLAELSGGSGNLL